MSLLAEFQAWYDEGLIPNRPDESSNVEYHMAEVFKTIRWHLKHPGTIRTYPKDDNATT